MKLYCVCPVNPTLSLVYGNDIYLSVLDNVTEVAPGTDIKFGNNCDSSYLIATDVVAVNAKGVAVCPPAGSTDEFICPKEMLYNPLTVVDAPLLIDTGIDLLKLIV